MQMYCGDYNNKIFIDNMFNVFFELEVSGVSGNVFVKVNGNTTFSSAQTFNTYANKEIILFNTAKSLFSNFEIYDKDGVMLHNFVSCYNENIQKYGMYDIINNSFKENAGTGDFTGSSICNNPIYFYPISDLVSEYDANLTQTFYLDYNGTMPTLSEDYTYAWYSDINCTINILPANFVSGTRYYCKATYIGE